MMRHSEFYKNEKLSALQQGTEIYISVLKCWRNLKPSPARNPYSNILQLLTFSFTALLLYIGNHRPVNSKSRQTRLQVVEGRPPKYRIFFLEKLTEKGFNTYSYVVSPKKILRPLYLMDFYGMFNKIVP